MAVLGITIFRKLEFIIFNLSKVCGAHGVACRL